MQRYTWWSWWTIRFYAAHRYLCVFRFSCVQHTHLNNIVKSDKFATKLIVFQRTVKSILICKKTRVFLIWCVALTYGSLSKVKLCPGNGDWPLSWRHVTYVEIWSEVCKTLSETARHRNDIVYNTTCNKIVICPSGVLCYAPVRPSVCKQFCVCSVS